MAFSWFRAGKGWGVNICTIGRKWYFRLIVRANNRLDKSSKPPIEDLCLACRCRACMIDSLAPGKCCCNFKLVISMIDIWSISCEISLRCSRYRSLIWLIWNYKMLWKIYVNTGKSLFTVPNLHINCRLEIGLENKPPCSRQVVNHPRATRKTSC